MDNQGKQDTEPIRINETRSTYLQYRKLKCIANHYVRELKARRLTKPTLLLVVYMFAINSCTVTAYETARDLTTPLGAISCWEQQPIREKTAYSILTICRNVLFLLIPVAGWVADTRIGRGSALVISLWTGWIGTLLQSLSSSLQYRICGSETALFAVAKYGLSTVSILLLLVLYLFAMLIFLLMV